MSTSKNEFIVAIELGSSKLTAMAGHMQPDGNLNVLAVKEIPSSGFMLYGTVHNLEKTKSALTEAIDYLQNTLQKRITKVYVALECQGMHSEVVPQKMNYNTDTITEEMVVQMQADAKAKHQLNMMTHHSYPIEYRVGGQVINDDPVGVLGDTLEGKFINIVTRRSVFENLERSFNDTGLADVSFRIGTRALKSAILQESQTRSNCIMIDFGAQLTTVAIYNKSKLHHLAVLPLGSAHITKDLMSLGIEEREAEKLKRDYGMALCEGHIAEEVADKDILLTDGRTIKQSLVIEIVEARMQEIMANVREQMRMNHYRPEDLLGGVIVTGGGSHIKFIREAVTHFLGIEKVEVATKPLFTVVGQIDKSKVESASYNTLFGLIKRAKDNCCGGDLKLNEPATDLFEQVENTSHTAEGAAVVTEKTVPSVNIEGEAKPEKENQPKIVAEQPEPLPAGDDEDIDDDDDDDQKTKNSSMWGRAKNFFTTLFSNPEVDDDESV